MDNSLFIINLFLSNSYMYALNYYNVSMDDFEGENNLVLNS